MADDIDIRILRAMRDAIEETGAFGEVRIGPPPEEQGLGASRGNACTIEIPRMNATPQFGGGNELVVKTGEKVQLTIIARHDSDHGLRDETALSLLNEVKRAINGRSLDGLNVLDHTYVESAVPLPPRHPERRYRAVVTLEYLSDWRGQPVS